MLATATKLPFMAISEQEAEKLAKALINLQSHYKIDFNPVWLAWFQLLTAGAAIYGPRLAFAVQYKKQMEEQARQAQAVNVPTGDFQPETPSSIMEAMPGA